MSNRVSQPYDSLIVQNPVATHTSTTTKRVSIKISIDDEYVCGRKYCRYCLKNYDDGKEKSNGLCPYCRGICYCTRCSRNDMMVRLKSMYILMGGDINRLQRGSLFEKYYGGGEEAMDLRKKEK